MPLNPSANPAANPSSDPQAAQTGVRTPGLPQPHSLLLLSGEPQRACVALVEPVAGRHRLVGWAETPLAAPGAGRSSGLEQLSQELGRLCQELGAELGRPLWDESRGAPWRPAGARSLELDLDLDYVLALITPLPPLRVWLAGLSRGESLAAGQEALGGAMARVVAQHRLGHGTTPQELAQELVRHQPDAAVVLGGYDLPAGGEAPVLALSHLVGQAMGLLPASQRPTLFYAGNHFLAEKALARLVQAGNVAALATDNVAPGPGRFQGSALAAALGQLYWERAQHLPWTQALARWVTSPARLRTVAWAFSRAVQGWLAAQDLSELHGAYTLGSRRLHVWARQGEPGVRLRFVEATDPPQVLEGWPPLGLVSGPWPEEVPSSSGARWWDPLGLTPLVAAAGQVDPRIALEVMAADLF